MPTSNLCVLDFSPSGLCDWNSGYNNPGPNPQVNCWLIELTFGVFGIWDRVCCILFGIWNGAFGFWDGVVGIWNVFGICLSV